MSPDHGNSISAQPNCRDETDKALAFDAARAQVESQVRPVSGREVLALRSTLGRFLDRAVISPADVPPHRNSAMDGYALAGAPYSGPALEAGQCVRIMTQVEKCRRTRTRSLSPDFDI